MIKAQDPAPVVQFSQVVKTYSGNRVVDELSFSVPRGTTFGLLGPNGAGKSTSLKALMGLLKIDSGRIDLFGEDISKIRQTSGFVPLRQRVGYVSEEHNIYRWMKVWQAIKFVKSFYTTWNEPLVDELLGAFELDSNRKVSQLSKGVGQVVFVIGGGSRTRVADFGRTDIGVGRHDSRRVSIRDFEIDCRHRSNRHLLEPLN